MGQRPSAEEPGSTTSPERVDLRTTSACMPYPAAIDQGDNVSCVVQAVSMALYCSKVAHGLDTLPASGHAYLQTEQLYARALQLSDDPRQGTSFDDVLNETLRMYADDLRALGCRPRFLKNRVEDVRDALRRGHPVVAGYQVNKEIDAFHESRRECENFGFMLPAFSRDPRSTSAHCVLIVGFDDSVLSFIARNSWGRHWGVDGHFLIRYRDLEDKSFFTDLMTLDCEQR